MEAGACRPQEQDLDLVGVGACRPHEMYLDRCRGL